MKRQIFNCALIYLMLVHPVLSSASDDLTQTGRYTDYSLDPQVEVIEPLEVVINVRLPNRMNYVGEAIEYLLQRSGYQIEKNLDTAPQEMFVLFSRFIPAQQKTMGTLRLHKALDILAGPAYELKINHVTREISFKLKEEYSSSLEGIEINDYRELWTERLSRNSVDEIRIEDSSNEGSSGMANQIVTLPSGEIRYGPVRSGETLGEIAKMFTSDDADLNMVMFGIFDGNKDSFINKNMNKLKAVSTLVIPSGEQLASIDSQKAKQVAEKHFAEYKRGRVQ